MKSMKGLKSLIRRTTATNDPDEGHIDSPEGNAVRAIRLFCDSGSQNAGGDEVLHLPVIVESVESSPVAAADAARQIRSFLAKDYNKKPHVQYNAIMLMRILSDHPGAIFTRNFDEAFVTNVRKLLRDARDPSLQQILRETLYSLEASKRDDEGCKELLQMWAKEKSTRPQPMPLPPMLQESRYVVGAQGERHLRRMRQTLPEPAELASRIEESRNTARILMQLVQSTPADELLSNELVREFGDRCQTASRSMQGYIDSVNPLPDHDTMQTLIETNEQLTMANTRYQRAMLAARRIQEPSPARPPRPQAATEPVAPASTDTSSNVYSAFAPATNNADTVRVSRDFAYQPPAGPPPGQRAAREESVSPEETPVNPFSDPSDPQHSGTTPFIEPANYGWEPSSDTTTTTTAKRPSTPPQSTTTTYSAFHPSPIASNPGPAYNTTANHTVSPTTTSTFTSAFAAPVSPASDGRASPLSTRPPTSTTSAFADPKRDSYTTKAVPAPTGGATEIDGHSQVGRRDREPTTSAAGVQGVTIHSA
jgi:hypothetical protein